jgi:predicted ATPase
MPVLEALGRLCREPGGDRLIELLGQHAPTWLVQMPALLDAQEAETLYRRTQGATRERMLREMAEAMEALTAERPLVLWLEDLHWSDVSTLELLAVLARRRERARLLILGSYRSVEMLANEHPLRAVKQELQLHKQCEELPLGFLMEEEVAEYLMQRLPVSPQPTELRQVARLVHQRTEGNPLFMVNVVDYLLAQGGETQFDGPPHSLPDLSVVPESIQQMIEKQLDRLSPDEQRVLEVASVAGADFSAAAVAAGTETEIGGIEARCVGLARRDQFLRPKAGEAWPDGTVAAHYSFIHALYQEVVYERVTAGQRVVWHNRIGERKERAYGERAREIAAELALHFEQGRDYRRAISYLQQAGENAAQRSAHMEASSHFTKGLVLLQTLPDTPERARSELMLQLALGTAMQATKGHGAPEVGEIYARARVLCQQLGEASRLFPVLFNQWQNYNVQGEFTIAADLGRQLLQLAEQADDAELFLEAHHALWTTSFCLGEFVPARDHHKRGWAIYDPQQHHTHAFVYGGHDPGVCSRSQEALVLWALGYPAQALQQTQAALALAHELAHPMSLGIALSWAAIVYQFRREARRVREHAEAAIALCSAQGFSFYLAWGTIMQGWALAEQGHHEEGIAQMRQGLAAQLATGAKLLRPYYLALLAETYGRAGQAEKGLTAVAEALAVVDKTGERHYEAELYRLKGELILQSSVQRLASKQNRRQTAKSKRKT